MVDWDRLLLGPLPDRRLAPLAPLEPLLSAETLAEAQKFVERHAEPATKAAGYAGIGCHPEAKAKLAAVDREILATELPIQRAIVMTAAYSAARSRDIFRVQSRLVSKLLRRDLQFDREPLVWLLWCAAKAHDLGWQTPWEAILRQLSGFLERAPLDDGFREILPKIRDDLKAFSKTEKIRLQIDQFLAGPAAAAITVPIVPGEAWSDMAIADLAAMSDPQRVVWNALLAHAATARSSKPSGTWLKKANPAVACVGVEAFVEQLQRWLGEIGKPGSQPPRLNMYLDFESTRTLISDSNADLLKGLVWASATTQDARASTLLGRCAEVSYRKIPQFGPRCVKLGNACVQALAIIGSPAAVSQIVRIKTRNKYPSIQSLISGALSAAAEKAGVSLEELEEISVPTFGLDADGRLQVPCGDFIGEIMVAGSDQVELRWLRSDGKPQVSVPKVVKELFPAELKELKQTADELKKILPAYQARIESLYLQRRSWDFPNWKEHYLDHPLVGRLAKRLIWSFSGDGATRSGIWHNGELVTSSGALFDHQDETTSVSLWHPIDESAEAVLAWRNWLTEHEVTQPFKQAHREVYLLTPAEAQTRTYSNRFAAHILKQHQFAALCQQRGWRFHLMGEWDSANTPEKSLPEWDLRCEFWVEYMEGTEVSQSMIYLYLSTDQVRFYNLRTGAQLHLEEVPRLPFSELMRDADLFIGVASVGNDPAWQDGGRVQNTYWQHYSFGELSESARTRRDVLAQIVPKLKIADRCQLDGNYLVVRGDLRTYKIHLGSANILMSPNDRYLCIVSARGAKESRSPVFLPFEGDNTLTLILSKAMLLADDRKIKDPTIVAQIQAAS